MQWDCFHLDDVVAQIAAEHKIDAAGVRATIELLDSGNTIPFIARYRKELTGALDEMSLRAIEDALEKARQLADRKATILRTIEQLGELNAELQQQIEQCRDRQLLEDLYLPYKPKRRTRATMARERGLQPLADILLLQQPLGRSPDAVLVPFVDPDKDVPDTDAALQGACDIVAEHWSEDAATRAWLARHASDRGQISSQVRRGKKTDDCKFSMYFDHTESLKRVPSHRLLAMKRGEAEGILRVSLVLDDEFVLGKLQQRLVGSPGFEFHKALRAAAEDCYQRLLLPAIQSVLVQECKERADEEAITVFAKNMRELLLAPPAGAQITIGIDPGFRTGCKVAVVDGTGKYLEHATIFPTAPRKDLEGAERTLLQLIQRHHATLIAVGNGTASRETDSFVTDLIRKHELVVTKVMVSESGASVYSASELAVAEYPDLDVTVRGAISIAHRLQDPLAELVKIDPKSIGVGQYQHDVNQTLLRKSLQREVESCVNSVGVDANLASGALLSHVAGIGPKLAERIVQYRDGNGAFKTRKQLTKVPKLGQRAFLQAAGFLRIDKGSEPLDNSAVHPESYHVVQKMAKALQVSTAELVGNASLVQSLVAEDFVSDDCGLLTVQDILAELAKPGRDPRREFKVAEFSAGVQQISDLKQGMNLQGVITNVTRFGAFVDVGVHQDGLIHISQMADRYVADPSEIVAVGDVVQVEVLEVDVTRKRISMKRVSR